MLESLKRKVLDANVALQKNGLVKLTWGNVSEIDRETGLVVIKPSGVPYDELTVKDMMVVDLMGNVVDGVLRPSTDMPTHIELYRAFDEIGAITHTHSTFATSFAQAGRDIPFYGTTHADCFYGDVPCVRALTQEEVEGDYETNTAYAIIDTIEGMDPMEVPAVLVKSHGAFTFGNDADHAVEVAVELEEIAKMAFITEMLNPDVDRADAFLLDKHYYLKRGKKA
jgi:L-ribulose-5-phosphate 4-epimerase